jgi:hypothetical protein
VYASLFSPITATCTLYHPNNVVRLAIFSRCVPAYYFVQYRYTGNASNSKLKKTIVVIRRAYVEEGRSKAR